MFGVPVTLGAFKGRVHPDYSWPEFLRILSDCGAHISGPDARILLDTRNLVAAISLPIAGAPAGVEPGIEAVIKEFRVSGLKKMRTLLVPGKAMRAWRGAAACFLRRVPTPLPLAYIERREHGLIVESYFVASRIMGAQEIRGLLRTLPPEDLSRLLAALARFLEFAHNQGILHLDLSDGNVLVRSSSPGEYEFFLIDTNRIRICSAVPLLGRVRNLVRLGVPLACQNDFLRLYLGDKRSAAPLRLWYRLNKRWYTGFVAFKKALRLKRLAERLGIQ